MAIGICVPPTPVISTRNCAAAGAAAAAASVPMKRRRGQDGGGEAERVRRVTEREGVV